MLHSNLSMAIYKYLVNYYFKLLIYKQKGLNSYNYILKSQFSLFGSLGMYAFLLCHLGKAKPPNIVSGSSLFYFL